MLKLIWNSFAILLALTILTGVVYPLAVTGIAAVAFPHQAGGSLIKENDKVVGSTLIGQQFEGPQYFWGRLSATGPFPYNSAISSGSNYGPQNPALKAAVESRVAALKQFDPDLKDLPVDLITASASGLDPHISPAAAAVQVRRVAEARKMTATEVEAIVRKHTLGRQLGILGEPRVNVLELNRDLDALVSR